MHCNKCRKVYSQCYCKVPHSNITTSSSEASGRDGLSTYDITVLTGKFIGTEAELVVGANTDGA